jgi:hypothetical protein
MWFWGPLTVFFLRRHIAREIKPTAVAEGFTRDEAFEATCNKLREHFDAAWPTK